MQYNQYRSYVRRGQSGSAALVGEIALQPQFKWFGRWNARRAGAAPRASSARYLERVQEEQPGSGAADRPSCATRARPATRRYTAGGTAEDRRTQALVPRTSPAASATRGWSSASSRTRSARSSASPRSRRKARLANAAPTASTCSPSCPTPRSTSRRAPRTGSRPRGPHRQAAAPGRRVEGARVHAQRDPLRLDRQQHQARAATSRAAWVASTSSSPPPSTAAARCTTSAGSTAASNIWRDRQRVVPPAQARARHSAHHRDPPVRTPTATSTSAAPGYSGGTCNGGPLPIGSWWPKRALMFAKNSTTWLRPPRGYRYGWPKGPGLRAYAGDQVTSSGRANLK